VPNITLSKGQKVMRVYMETGGFNLNDVNFVLTNAFPTTSITSPANNTTYSIAPANVTINATATDSDGTISKVEFYRGTTKLGEDATSPYSFLWSSAPAGTYSLTVKAIDNLGGITTSSAISIKVGNALPTSSITSPANNTTIETAPATITINATASDSDGSIKKVEFFQGTIKLGEDLTSPYSYTWSGVVAGTYSLTVKATDNLDAVGSASAIVKVIVGNKLPVASITSPVNNFTYATTPANITINATASDADGTISKVEFYRGTTKLGEDATSPYSLAWNNVSSGTYSLTVKAIDNLGSVGNASTAVTVKVNYAPAVSITAPTNGTTYSSVPASITINATASDQDGTIKRVEFYDGTTLLGSTTVSPYTFNWTTVTGGSHSLTAKAIDNLDMPKTSSVVGITVSTGCSAPQWNAGNTSYTTGTVVKNTVNGVVKKYQCTVAGWCQSSASSYYEPGNGSNWTDCWTDLGVCANKYGVYNVEVQNALEVFPNPSINVAFIKGHSTEGKATIYLINSMGVEVLTKEVDVLNGEFNCEIDLGNFPSGIYIIKAHFGNSTLARTLYKN
jgi:ferredoxin-NADP reductase